MCLESVATSSLVSIIEFSTKINWKLKTEQWGKQKHKKSLTFNYASVT